MFFRMALAVLVMALTLSGVLVAAGLADGGARQPGGTSALFGALSGFTAGLAVATLLWRRRRV